MDARDLQGLLPVRLAAVRAASEALAAPLSDEDCGAQSMPDASPVKWHLAHTTWFFETFVLEAFEPGFAPFDPAFRMLFNSYYEAVGDRPPRPQRGLLTRPSRATVQAWRVDVNERLRALLERPLPARALQLIEIGLNHEQQHQELIVTDLKHLLAQNPLAPAYRVDAAGAQPGNAAPPSLRWVGFDEGIVTVGASADAPGIFAFDNETPRHRRFLEAYQLADRLSTNAEYLAFVEAGGYRDPRWWLSEGWDWVRREGLSLPIYWRRQDDRWMQFTLAGLVPLAPNEPVAHLSYFEADAFARWSGARLPTEFEWEHAAEGLALEGTFADAGRLHPQPVESVTWTDPATSAQEDSTAPATAARGGAALRQLYGELWQWTSSSYAPYPGFAPVEGAVGEYNGKFMVNQYVLRGASCVTPRDHARASYRNFFPTTARWQFAGVRLARALAA